MLVDARNRVRIHDFASIGFFLIIYNVLTPNFGKNWLKNSPNPLFSSRIYIFCTYIYFFYDNSCPRIGNLSKCIP